MTTSLPPAGNDERYVPAVNAAAVPTQVANPNRTTLRSIVQALVTLVPIVNGTAAAVIAYLTELGIDAPAWVWAALNGAVFVTALVAGLVTRIMAVPGVEAWLRQYLPALAALAPAR